MSQNDEISDVKMSESSLRSIPVPSPPFNPSSSTYDPYEINKHVVKYDPVDAREFKQLFGNNKYMYFKKDNKHQQYQLALFIVSENPKHYAWKGAYTLIEELMAHNTSGDLSTSLTDNISCIHPKKKGGFAVSCTYRFVHNMDKPQEIIKLYYLIEKYFTKNENLCNYIGCDRNNVRCHLLTNKQQIYNNRYLLFNVPLNIDSIGLFDKENAVQVTKFIEKSITTQNKAGRYRWQRIKSSYSGIITQSIELETLKPITIANKQIHTLDINWTVDEKKSQRIIKIINTGRKPQLETFKIYNPEEVETNFMKIHRKFEEKKNQKQEAELERRIDIINTQFISEREQKNQQSADFRRSIPSTRAMTDAINNLTQENNNDHNHNNNNNQSQDQEEASAMDIDLHTIENSANTTQSDPSDIYSISGGSTH